MGSGLEEEGEGGARRGRRGVGMEMGRICKKSTLLPAMPNSYKRQTGDCSKQEVDYGDSV